MFDKKWNDEIYLRNKQINKYPYDWVVSRVNRYFSKNIKYLKKETALELGSGTGNNLKFLSEFGFGKVEGVEGSIKAVQYASDFLKKIEGIQIFNLDFINLPMEDEKYIFCLDRGSITHNSIPDIEQTLNEVYRVLKPGGYFFSAMFSSNHSQLSYSKKFDNYVLSFADIMGVKDGIKASFFQKKDIYSLFSKFEIVEFIHEMNINFINEKSSTAMWNIVAKKN